MFSLNLINKKCDWKSVGKAYFKYIFALLLFGLNGVIANQISLNSYEIVFMRTLIGSLFLIVLFKLTQKKTCFLKNKLHFFYLAISGAAMGTSWIFLYEAYQQIGVNTASLAYYCGPVIVMILSPLLFSEKLTLSKIIGFFIVLSGIFFINMQALNEGKTKWGLFCGIASAVMYAFMVIFNKKAKTITGLENAMLQLCISFLTVAIFVILKQGFVIHIAGEDWIPILILGLLNTAIGCYFYFSSIDFLPVQTVSICGYLEPLSAVIFSIQFLGEKMQPVQIIGAFLILVGAILGECLN